MESFLFALLPFIILVAVWYYLRKYMKPILEAEKEQAPRAKIVHYFETGISLLSASVAAYMTIDHFFIWPWSEFGFGPEVNFINSGEKCSTRNQAIEWVNTQRTILIIALMGLALALLRVKSYLKQTIEKMAVMSQNRRNSVLTFNLTLTGVFLITIPILEYDSNWICQTDEIRNTMIVSTSILVNLAVFLVYSCIIYSISYFKIYSVSDNSH